MPQLFANNAASTLAAAITAADTSLTLAAGTGSKFPSPTAGDFFLLTLTQAGQETSWEIVKVTARAGDVLAVARAQEGTAAASWIAGARIELRLTKGGLDAKENTGTAAAAIVTHEAASDPHPQYTTTAEAAAAAPVQSVAGKTGAVTLAKGDVGLGNVDNTSDATKPISTATQTALDGKQATLVSGTNIKTINGASLLGAGNIDIVGTKPSLQGDQAPYVTQTKTYQITNYNSFSTYSVAASAGTASITGDTITYAAPATAGSVNLTLTVDGKPTVFALTVLAAGVATPTNTGPSNGAIDQNSTVTLTSSEFAWLGLSDAHLNSDWQLATDAGFVTIVQSASADATNKTSWTVSGLSTSQTYYWRVRHRGANNGISAWSTGTSFATKAELAGKVGTAGTQGFGVGVCPDAAWLTTLGLTAMVGTTDKASPNYGNYQHTNGGISVFVPKFYYRYGDAADPAYATYGAKTLTIKGIETFSGETAANMAGYALHRAFINNGVEVPGFFLDKYLASKDGAGSCKSEQNGNPISLTTYADYSPSGGMTGCTGILADAVVLSRARGAGWNAELVFMRDAIAKLTDSHAQHSTSTTYCAWYDADGVTNFPKGCNDGNLADINDATVTFSNATPDIFDNKPLTGSASNLAKTTHNGQSCGIADVNGAMWQALLGLTQAGTSATDALQNTTGDAYVLKRTARHANLTGGFGGTTDAWGTTSSLATNYDLINGFLPWTSATGWEYFGNGSNQVFSGATSGTDYLRSCVGIANTTGMSSTGTNQFGTDGNYRYGIANLFPMASGIWYDASDAGVFYRIWDVHRSIDFNGVGFRAAAYGN